MEVSALLFQYLQKLGDRRGLLSLKRVGVTRIVTVAEFLKILKKKR